MAETKFSDEVALNSTQSAEEAKLSSRDDENRIDGNKVEHKDGGTQTEERTLKVDLANFDSSTVLRQSSPAEARDRNPPKIGGRGKMVSI